MAKSCPTDPCRTTTVGASRLGWRRRPAVNAVGEPVPAPAAEVRADHIAAADRRGSRARHRLRRWTHREPSGTPSRGRAWAVACLVVARGRHRAGRGGPRLAGWAGGDSHSASTSATFQPVAGALAENSTTTTAASPQTRSYENANRRRHAERSRFGRATADARHGLVRRALSSTTGLGGLHRHELAHARDLRLDHDQHGALCLVRNRRRELRRRSCRVATGGWAPSSCRPGQRSADGAVVLLVYDAAGTASGSHRLVAFDAASCEVLVDRPL